MMRPASASGFALRHACSLLSPVSSLPRPAHARLSPSIPNLAPKSEALAEVERIQAAAAEAAAAAAAASTSGSGISPQLREELLRVLSGKKAEFERQKAALVDSYEGQLAQLHEYCQLLQGQLAELGGDAAGAPPPLPPPPAPSASGMAGFPGSEEQQQRLAAAEAAAGELQGQLDAAQALSARLEEEAAALRQRAARLEQEAVSHGEVASAAECAPPTRHRRWGPAYRSKSARTKPAE